MKHTSTSSMTSRLSGLAHQLLNTYSLAACAAGVTTLALAQPAEAEIVYTPARHVIGPNTNYQLDLNHDGIPDFTFVNKFGCNFDFCFGSLSAIPLGGNAVEGAEGLSGFLSAYALNGGSPIGSGRAFSGQLMAGANMGTVGNWVNVTNRYLGLKFQVNGEIHYGWARLSVSVKNGDKTAATLTGYAYETIANKPIIAGKTSGTDDAELPANASITPGPEPATPALLALGSSGLSVWRRKEPVHSTE